MSTILDALKKSEQERKLNDIPTLTDMPAIEEPSPLKWVGLTIAALLVVSILAALILLLLSPNNRVTGLGQLQTQQPPEVSSEATAASAVLSVLSYSENAEQRFAIINDKLVREGDFLATGIKVDSISADRVELIVKGDRITLQP